MRIGNWLGGSVIWRSLPSMGWRQPHAPPSTSRLSHVGGSLDGQSGDHYFGVYVPTRFGGELQIKTTDGKIVELKRPNGAPLDERPGHRI